MPLRLFQSLIVEGRKELKYWFIHALIVEILFAFLSFFLSLLVRSYMSITPGSANLEILIK